MLIVNGIANPKVNAVDKSMFKAQGPLWHKNDRKKGIVPKNLRNVDTDSEWGYSKYRGWVQGYALHLICSATPGFVPVPLDADAVTANVPENRIFESMIDHLHDDSYNIQFIELSHSVGGALKFLNYLTTGANFVVRLHHVACKRFPFFQSPLRPLAIPNSP